MRNRYFKNSLALFTAALMFAGIFGSAVGAGGIVNKQALSTDIHNNVAKNTNSRISWGNYTVYEVWDLLSTTVNGIQTPVDVRTNEEWNVSYLDTPYPESPIHYPLTLLQTTDGLQQFINLYDGKDIIFTCKGGGRSAQACKILAATNFTGTINNMLGGITGWIAAGLPVRTNAGPNAPTILGPSHFKVGIAQEFTFYGSDPNEDGLMYFIDWGDSFTKETGYYYSGAQFKLSHTWSVEGTYNITAKTTDYYGLESDWGTLKIVVPINQISSQSTPSPNQQISQQSSLFFKILEQLLSH
jgi:rhodanese-related sulfurtransferase